MYNYDTCRKIVQSIHTIDLSDMYTMINAATIELHQTVQSMSDPDNNVTELPLPPL